MNTIHWNRQIKSKTKMYQMPSQKPDISKIILQNVLRKHIHVTSLTDNIQTNIKVMINTKWEQLAVELNWFIFISVWCHPDVDGDCADDVIRTRGRRHPCTRDILRMRAEDRRRTALHKNGSPFSLFNDLMIWISTSHK